ncbi:hypothetical protein D3C85_1263670 [compost metagenome]
MRRLFPGHHPHFADVVVGVRAHQRQAVHPGQRGVHPAGPRGQRKRGGGVFILREEVVVRHEDVLALFFVDVVQRCFLSVVFGLGQQAGQVRERLRQRVAGGPIACGRLVRIVVHVRRNQPAILDREVAQVHHFPHAVVVVVAGHQQRVARGHHEHGPPAHRDALQHVRQQGAADVVAIRPRAAIHALDQFSEIVGLVAQVFHGNG